MREKTTRAQLAIGLIGLGPTWEQHYHEAVRRLSSKLCVRAVCDAVHVRAAAVANEFHAATFSCPWQLSQRSDIKAWLILDAGWFGIYPAELAVWCGRPTLFANCFGSDPQRLTVLFEHAIERGESLLAEFPQRFLPATTRLRELITTKLGPVRRISIQVPTPRSDRDAAAQWLVEQQADCVGLLDWSACLIGQPAATVEYAMNSAGSRFQVSFVPRPDTAANIPPLAEIVLMETAREEDRPPRRLIECEHGSAIISSPTNIAWQTNTLRADESLLHERPPIEIILDQFCRRALGGLVPVPTLSDAVRGLAMLQAATESLSTEDPVSVKSAPHH
jgi:predicted dehydrogenase